MSSMEKPTLGGTRIKTRKRNIAAPLDPAAFSDAVVQIYLDNAGDLELVAKSLESSDLNFSRYGDIFFEAGLTSLVEYNDRKIFEVKLKEIKAVLTSQVTDEINVDEVIETVKQQVKDAKLPEIEVVHVIWDGIMDSVQWSGKNQQQNSNAVLRQVKTWAPLLNTLCSSGNMEMELMYKVQRQCYEDAKLMKVFPEVVRSLYELDVLAEDTVLHWYRKGTNPKGRQTFVKGLEPFVNWLEEAEEEE